MVLRPGLKSNWPVVLASAVGLVLVAGGFLWFSHSIPGFDTRSNLRELKDHREKYDAIVAAILKHPLPKEGDIGFLLSPPGAATPVTPCPPGYVHTGNGTDYVFVKVKPGRLLIWITTFPGNHFGQYYLVYCSNLPVMAEDFSIYEEHFHADEHWWAVEDHSG